MSPHLAAVCLGWMTFMAASRVEAQPTPAVAQVPSSSAPALPVGMKVTCPQGPATGAPAATCPVLHYDGYTYWALSYVDDRVGLAIAAYDSMGKLVARWEKPGVRYVHGITVSPVNRTVTFAGQSDAKLSIAWDDLVPPPVVIQVPPSMAPEVPVGMKVTCTRGPGTGAAAATCPVVEWKGYTFWAFSYTDNRLGLGIVTYDSMGKVVAMHEKTGSRYVYAITVNPSDKTVTFAGQADARVSSKWSELLPSPAS